MSKLKYRKREGESKKSVKIVRFEKKTLKMEYKE